MINYVVVALIGALAAFLSNRGIAVFNDGFRPIMPEYFEGRMDRKTLAATSFAISFGLVIGFGLPTSLASSIILIHCILLTTDIIGVFCPNSKIGAIAAAVIGAVYGVGLMVGLQFIIDIFALLPVNFLSEMGTISTPITVAFAVFPAVTVGLQFGAVKGLITGAFQLLVRQLIVVFGSFSIGDKTVTLNADGMTLLAGMIVLIVMAILDKEGQSNANEQLTKIFENNMTRIRKNWWVLGIMGGLLAMGTNLAILAGDPISQGLLAEGLTSEAALTAFARAIGFIPLIATTAIATGVYAPAGMTFVFAIGFISPNWIVALIGGALCIVAEVFLLSGAAVLLDKFPGVKRCGDNIRTAMGRVIDVALLVGGMMAAYSIAGGLGLFVVVGLYGLNKTAKKPLVDMAIGPVGAIITGVLVNLLHIIGLYPIA